MPRPKKEKPNRKDGLHEVKVTLGKTFDGKLNRKSFYSSISKADARSQAEEYKIQQAAAELANVPFISKDMNFGSWATVWLKTYKKDSVKPNTYNFTYKSNVDKYLIPHFGKADLKIIKPADIQAYFNSVNHLSLSVLDKQRIILNDIFEKAIDSDLCYKNPVRGTNIKSKHTQKERNVYNLEQYDAALKYSMNQDDGLAVSILLSTGIRRSELVGLKWSDFDFDKKFVHIQRGVVPTKSALIEDDVKSKSSNRIIPLSDGFCDYLKLHISENEYVLSTRSPNTYAKWHDAFTEKATANAKLDPLTPHEMRHTFGTILREKGVDIYTIQKVMGHSDIKVTAGVYIHNDLDVLRKNMGLE